VSVSILQTLLAGAALLLSGAWIAKFRRTPDLAKTTPTALAIGAVANFFDTLGIGSFAPTTAAIKAFKLAPDDQIPGTLNVGHALPTIAQALIFIAIVKVDPALLVACIVAAVAGALAGARVVVKLPERTIRAGMGAALLVAAALYSLSNLGLMPGGGSALTLAGGLFAAAVVIHLVLGALMTLGIGLYAPSLIALSLLGMDPRAAFPIMMGSCAFLMPAASLGFLKAGRFAPSVALGLAIGGIPAVLVAALIVKELPLEALRWLVAAVVAIVGATMLAEAAKIAPSSPKTVA
jgi:uncharacterized membrane protein YfcA